MKSRCLFAAALAGLLSGPVFGARAGETNDWSFDVSPYLWIASVEAETRLPGVPPSTPSEVDRCETRIRAGAMIAAQLRHRSLGAFVDFAWLRLDTEARDPGPAFSSVELQSDLFHLTTALTYGLPLRGKLHADLLAGTRLWHVDEELEYKAGTLPGFKVEGDKTWVDPLAGVDLRYVLSPRCTAGVKGTVGGFGVSADLAWEVFCSVGCRVTDWCSVMGGYRYLHEDYDREHFTFNMDVQGFLLGLTFHF